jgi:hypothetical protein
VKSGGSASLEHVEILAVSVPLSRSTAAPDRDMDEQVSRVRGVPAATTEYSWNDAIFHAQAFVGFVPLPMMQAATPPPTAMVVAPTKISTMPEV